MDIAPKPEPSKDKPGLSMGGTGNVEGRDTEMEADAEAQAMLGLAQWINCQGDSGEAAELMDEAKRRNPGKF